MIVEKSCGAIVYRIFTEEIEFLAVKSKVYGHWGFPKGHMENGESEELTAIREVFEETGLSVNLLNGFKAKTQYLINEVILKEVIYFIGISLEESINIQAEEIQEFRWLKYSEMIDIMNFDNIKQMLKESYDFLLNSVI